MTSDRIPDRVRYARALRRAGSLGLHTNEIRHSGLSGNPSQRAAELRERGFRIRVTPEHKAGRNGARHVMLKDAGDSAAFITKGQLAVGGGAGLTPAPPRAATVRGPGSRIPPREPGSAARLFWRKDYTQPGSTWEEHVEERAAA